MKALTEGYAVKPYPHPTRRYVQTLQLRNDAALIEQYRHYHSREGIWPEILQGLKDSGVVEMEIYQQDTLLIMIVELDARDSWQEVMQRMGSGPRQAEWEAFTARFQKASAQAASEEKWQLMERIFHIYD